MTEPELLAAIADLQSGGSPMTSAIARKVVQSFQQPRPTRHAGDVVQLSPREKEIVELDLHQIEPKPIAGRKKLAD